MADSTTTDFTDPLTWAWVDPESNWPLFCDVIGSNVSLPAVYWAMAVVYPVDFFISTFGTILSFVFICYTKTNFMVRVFVYLSFALTLLQLVSFITYSVPMFDPNSPVSKAICWYMIGHITYLPNQEFSDWWQGSRLLYILVSVFITLMLVTAINIAMLTKLLCPHVCDNCCGRCNVREPSQKCKKFLECLLFLLFILLVAAFVLVSGILLSFGLLEANNLYTAVVYLYMLVISAFNFFFSMISPIILLVSISEICRFVPRAAVIAKEGVLFLSLFLVTFLTGLYGIFATISSPISSNIATVNFIPQLLCLSLLSLYPFCIFIYMWYSFRRRFNRRVRYAAGNDLEVRTGAEKIGEASTRVSFFSRTSQNHDPEMFLSPSTDTPSENTPLIEGRV